MKRQHVVLLMMLITVMLAVFGFTVVPWTSAVTYNASVDISTTYQTLEGFGAACAWYQNWLTAHPNKNEVINLLFNDLGVDIYRFRNQYDRDTGFADDIEIISMAEAAVGHPIKLMLSSWTPPADLKQNGVLNGGTLIKENGQFAYDRFADYWYNSLAQLAKNGVYPDYISIQNEPDYENTGWETCIFRPVESSSYPEYGKALDAVYQRLQGLSRVPKILGPETAGIGSNLVQEYARNMNLNQIYGVAHHLYNGGDPNNPDSFVSAMQGIVSAFPDKPLFQTEYDQGTPFTTALLMHHSLVEEGVNAYFFWDLIWDTSQRPFIHLEEPWNQGSWSSDKGYIITEFYHVFKHYSRFTDPGYKRVMADCSANDIKISAFVSPDSTVLTVILINQGNSTTDVALDLNGYMVDRSDVYRTIPNGSEKFASLGSLGAGNTVSLPGQSIATVVLYNPEHQPTPTPTPTPTSPPPLGEYVVYYEIANDWGHGATINVTIRNNSSAPINSWTLKWNFPGNQQITNLWNGDHTQTGTAVAVNNLSYNATIPPNGGKVSFGFNLSYSMDNAEPVEFELNDVSCQVQ